MLRFTAILVLLTSTLAAAQDPKKPKFTPGQIADAQNKLIAAKCSLNRPEALREDWEYFLRKPADPPAPIDLVGFPNDTSDADLAKLLPFAKRLPALKAVMLWNTDKITAKGLKLLAKELPDLQGLILTNVTIPDRDLGELASLPRLTWIEITDMPIRDAGLNELAAVPKLAKLTLIGTKFVTPRGITHLQKAKDLRELNMDISSDSMPFAEEIGKLTDLSRIHLFPVDDDEAAELGKLKNLVSLDLTPLEASAKATPWGLRMARTGGKLSDSGLKEFMECKSLATIRVAGRVRVEGVPELAKLEGLTELDLNSSATSDAGLAIIRKLKALTKLDLSYTAVTDEGVADLADLPRLEKLHLDFTKLGDKSLESLSQIRTLHDLTLDGTKVSATDARGLSQLSALRHLSLRATNVGPNSFPILGSARSVQVMDLRENCPNLSYRDIGPLQGMLPKGKVLADSCSLGGGWAGAIGYNFKLPEVRSPTSPRATPMPKTPVATKPMPMKEPPKVAPPTPPRTGGTSPAKP